MISIHDELVFEAGTPFRHFKPDTGLFDTSGVLLTPHEFKVTDVTWEIVKLHSKESGAASVLRQHALRALGLLDNQAYVDRRPSAGDIILDLEHGVLGAVKVNMDGNILYFRPHDKQLHKIPSQQAIVKPTQPFGYVQAGYPSFDVLVGLSEQGYLRRPKTAMLPKPAGAAYLLTRIKEFVQAGQTLISLDTETTGLTNRAFIDNDHFVIGLCVSWEGNSGFYLPVDGTPETRDAHIQLLEYLRDHCEVIMHNATFDILAVLQSYGVDLRAGVFHDTQVISKLVDENRLNHKLKPLSAELLGREDVITYDSVSNPDSTLVGIDPLIVTEYAAADSANTYALYEILMPQLQADPELHGYYERVEIPAISRIAVPIAVNGLKVDRPKLEELHARIEQDSEGLHAALLQSVQSFITKKNAETSRLIRKTLNEAYDRMESMYGDTADVDELALAHSTMRKVKNLAAAQSLARARQFKSIASFQNLINKALTKPADTYEFNPGSKLQLQELIHDHWGLPVVKITKTGEERKQEAQKWTKADERKYSSVGTKSIPAFQLALQQLKTSNPEAEAFFDTFSKHSKTTKLLSAFTRPTLENLDTSGTNIIHPNFNSLGTKSSRSSCVQPNLQQLPSDDSLYDLRDCFIPDSEEHVFIDADLTHVKVRQPVMAARKLGEFGGTPNSADHKAAVGNTEPR